MIIIMIRISNTRVDILDVIDVRTTYLRST